MLVILCMCAIFALFIAILNCIQRDIMNILVKKIVFACGIILGIGLCSPAYALLGGVGRAGAQAVAGVCRQCAKLLPQKPATIAATCIIGGVAARTLWTRCVRLRKLDEKINPNVALYIDQQEHPIYNWMMGAPGFTTPAQIRAHQVQVKESLKRACLSGVVDIFQYGTGIRLGAGHYMYWSDVLSSIDREIERVSHWLRSLESFVGLRVCGIPVFGIRRNFARVCDDLGIDGLDQMRQAFTVEQEERITAEMTADRSWGERAIALCMANPNYDVAHRIFWQLDQRLGRLRAIKEAVVATPVQWRIPLQ